MADRAMHAIDPKLRSGMLEWGIEHDIRAIVPKPGHWLPVQAIGVV
jgi:hypothetical protein